MIENFPDKIERIVFIEPRAPGLHEFSATHIPRLGLPLLSAIMKKEGRDVTVFCEDLSPVDWAKVAEADLVGFSTLTPTAPRTYRLVRKAKRIAATQDERPPILVGGPHVSFCPEEALDQGADFVVRGEGEITSSELIAAIEGQLPLSEVDGISYRDGKEFRHNPDRQLVSDLDSLPHPDLEAIEGFEKMDKIPIQTTRGCPYDCEFCAVVEMFGHRYRERSVEDVLEELEYYQRIRPRTPIFFYDDNFTADPERTKALLEGMKERGISPPSWSTQARVSCSEDADLLDLMARSGCSRLYVGIESINPDTLKEYNKGQVVEEIEAAIDKFHRFGIAVHGMFVLGGEKDDQSTVKETVDFALQKGLDTAQFLALTPIPGTRVYQKLKESGRIFAHKLRDWGHYDGHHVVFEPKSMSPLQLQKALMRANSRFYSWTRGLKWALRGKFSNSLFAFYGSRIIKRWKRSNVQFLKRLRRLSSDNSLGVKD